MSPPDWAQLNWSTLSSPVWRICTERWDHEHFDSHLSLTRCDPLWIFQVNILHIPFFQLFFVSCDGEWTIFGFLTIKMGILTNFLTFSRQKRLIKKQKSDNSMVRIRVSCSPTVYVIEEDCDLCDFHTFVCYTCFRWEQRWTLTCWNTMKTPSLLFCVCTAGESAGWEEVFTPPIIDFFFNVCVYVCFQGFGEAVELPDSAGLLPEPGLCLQSAAGQQTSLQLSVHKWSLCTRQSCSPYLSDMQNKAITRLAPIIANESQSNLQITGSTL